MSNGKKTKKTSGNKCPKCFAKVSKKEYFQIEMNLWKTGKVYCVKCEADNG